MLGRGIGISEEKLRHMGDGALPDGVYSEAEAAIVRYAQRSTRMLSIDNTTYQALAKHFSVQQIIEICLNVGLAQITNRFNATFLSDVDDYILDANKRADSAVGPARFTIRRCRLSSPKLKQNQNFTRLPCTSVPSAAGRLTRSWAACSSTSVLPVIQPKLRWK